MALIQAPLAQAGSKGRGKKNLAQNDPVALSYGRWRETDFGKKGAFFQLWTLGNSALREYGVEVHSRPRPNPSSIVALRFVL